MIAHAQTAARLGLKRINLANEYATKMQLSPCEKKIVPELVISTRIMLKEMELLFVIQVADEIDYINALKRTFLQTI